MASTGRTHGRFVPADHRGALTTAPPRTPHDTDGADRPGGPGEERS
jgi:hypothetical protein